MKFNNGYSNIKVKLLNTDVFDAIAEHAYYFGRFGREVKDVDANFGKYSDFKDYVQEVIDGKTFPKYFLEQRVEFEIRGISRICLAQLTRDRAFFCSEGGGVRPLTQEFNIPANIYADESVMDKVKQAQYLLEEAYIECLEKEYPLLDSRYIGLHCQTISVNASYSIGDFIRSCYNRTNNSFCDELNYVYRKMYKCLIEVIEVQNAVTQDLCYHFINEKSCIDDSYLRTMHLYNGDFKPSEAKYHTVDRPAQNDWRKSAWKIELEKILEQEPNLLTSDEYKEIKLWLKDEQDGKELYTTYDSNNDASGINAIKEVDYYNEHRPNS